MKEDEQLSKLMRIDEPERHALARLGVRNAHELLYYLPARYERMGDVRTIGQTAGGTDAVLYGTLRKPETRKTWKTKRAISEAWLEDGTGKLKLMWFNQPYIAKMYPDGLMVKVSGKIDGTPPYMANPEIERVDSLPAGGAGPLFSGEQDDLLAVYPETQGISSRWLRHAIARLLREGVHETLLDPIPEPIRARYRLPSLATALVWIHTPKRANDAAAARKRFAFEEVFTIQVAAQQERAGLATLPTPVISNARTRAAELEARLPFTLTRGQQAAVESILTNMSTPPAMSRLLEGDVGSGKTAVAALTSYAVVTCAPEGRPSASFQVAYMAPTEVLAQQHFESFIGLFKHLPIQLGLLTGSTCRKFPSKVRTSESTPVSRAQLLKQVASGEISMLIGTHALIQKSVAFRDLAYVIVDEQHRFGTNQRRTLVRKDGMLPHFLSMTATPIPRTLALTLYGDLDLTVLDEMPAGRKPIKTTVVAKGERAAMYASLREQLKAGRQAYVICPRIEEPDPSKAAAIITKSVTAEAARLAHTELSGVRLAVLHGQMKPSEKDAVMRAFLAHETDVLVATSVVEVGVNVPNATVIIIEGAERFGLAQLHQLRGRVVRSTHQAYCYLLTSEGQHNSRLTALAKAKSGFELAELDLKLRGPGELYGRSQSGLTDVGMEALKNIKLVEAAREEARALVAADEKLSGYPTLAAAVEARRAKLHFE